MSYGTQVKLGIARQTADGTAVTIPTSFHGLAFVSEDIGLEKAELISANLVGKFEQGAVYSGVSKVAGTITFELTPKTLLAALAFTVNEAPTTVTSGSVFTHTWVPDTVDYDSLFVHAPWTIYKQFSDSTSAEQFYDCQAGQLELSIGQGQFLKGKVSVHGGARTANGVGSASILPPVSDVGVLFPWNVGSISYGGAAMSQASDLTITFNENIEPMYTINGTLSPFKYTRNGFREVTVKGTFYMTDRALLNNFTSDTQARLLLTLVNTKTAIQSGYYNALTIDIPQLKITQFKPGASGPGEVSVSFAARGVIDPTSAYAIQFTTVSSWGAGF